MQTTHVDPVVTVTQIEKGDDIIEHPDVVDAMTASQKKLLKDVHHYEGRYGMVLTLHLRVIYYLDIKALNIEEAARMPAERPETPAPMIKTVAMR